MDVTTSPTVDDPHTRPGLWDPDQTIAYLGGISRAMLDRLVASGHLKATRIGAKTMFRPRDVDAFLDIFDDPNVAGLRRVGAGFEVSSSGPVHERGGRE